jgi:hypothetical protein
MYSPNASARLRAAYPSYAYRRKLPRIRTLFQVEAVLESWSKFRRQQLDELREEVIELMEERKSDLVGRKAIATLGPDYAPNEKVEVTILKADDSLPVDTWLCRDQLGRKLQVRTRKLRLLP